MLNLLKKGLLLLGSLFLLQVGGYALFAKEQLPKVVVQNRITLVFEEPEYVYFNSEQVLSEQQADDLSLVLGQTFPKLNPDRNSLDSLPDASYCSYHFNINNTIPFLAMVKYSNVYRSTEGDSAYLEIFESTYLWILFSWWEVENKNIAQS
jgi:hypothetical protein